MNKKDELKKAVEHYGKMIRLYWKLLSEEKSVLDSFQAPVSQDIQDRYDTTKRVSLEEAQDMLKTINTMIDSI